MILFAGIVLGNLYKKIAGNKLTEVEKLKNIDQRNILSKVTVPVC